MYLRSISHGAGTPAYNMAVDEALLLHVLHPVLRIYAWDRPAVSIGYFQKSAVVPPGREFVRRYTGGGLVDHARDLTYTIVLPRVHPLGQSGTSDMYCQVHRAISQALTLAGIDNILTPVALEGDASACFQKAVAHDIICPATKAKIAGAAQRRNRLGILHQGSILMPNGRTLPKELGNLLRAEIARVMELTIQPSELTQQERETAQQLELSRYSKSEWNEWGR